MANGRATQLVQDIQTLCKDLRDMRVRAYGLMERYTREGAATFTHLHFLDENGTPRTDLDITEVILASGVYGLTDTITALNTHASHLINAAN